MIYQRSSDGRWVGAISLGYDQEGKPRRRTVYGKTKREAQEKMSEERSELHDVGLHTLRHTHAAVLIHMGARPLDVQQRFGHKDVAFTLQRYGHLFPDDDEKTASLMDKFSEGLRAGTIQ